MIRIILSLLVSLALFSVAYADKLFTRSASDFRTVCAGKVVPIDSISGGGVLYKSENIHGGRGPTFLVQNVAERTGKQTIEIRNARCEVIGSFGLYATDQPYGARYYSRTGGSDHSDNELLALTQQVGSHNILVEGKGKWIRVSSPLERDGSVRK